VHKSHFSVPSYEKIDKNVETPYPHFGEFL